LYKQLIKKFENNPQEIKVFKHVTGSHFNKEHVIWDERKDGLLEIEAEKLGGYERIGDKLVFNQDLFDADQLLKQSKEDADSQERQKQIDMKALIKNGNASLKDRVDAIAEYLGL